MSRYRLKLKFRRPSDAEVQSRKRGDLYAIAELRQKAEFLTPDDIVAAERRARFFAAGRRFRSLKGDPAPCSS